VLVVVQDGKPNMHTIHTKRIKSIVDSHSREPLMPLNNKRYLVVRVRGCRSSGSCVFKRQYNSICKKGKIDLVCGNFVKNICKKALGFRGVSLYQYDSL
jgi:hypothetical protein